MTGEENDLCGERCPPDRDDVHVLGHVVGYPGSYANILFGEYGVYGGAEIPTEEGDVLAEFNMVESGEGYILHVTLRNNQSAPFTALW